jgi:hypothetical protein
MTVAIDVSYLETSGNWEILDNQGSPPDRIYWNQFIIGPSGTFHLLTDDTDTTVNVTYDLAFIRQRLGTTLVPGIDTTDDRLETTSKTLVGGVNELKTTTDTLTETTGTLTTDVGDLQTLYSGDLLSFLEAMNGGP